MQEKEVLFGVEPTTRIPYGVSRYYASLAEREDPDTDPIAAQYIPRSGEQHIAPEESTDPIRDGDYEVSPRFIHHYRDRALMLVNDRCATYCRHCFRRHFTGHGAGRISELEVDGCLDYLREHTEVREVLLSGGDPLMLADGELFQLIDRLRSVRSLMIRLCTRMPVVLPSRVGTALADGLSSRLPAWTVVQVNHPREITDEFRTAVSRLTRAGVPVANQAVLLRGINDSADTLESLCTGLLEAGVKPYYLFQGDLASGTSHFRVSIERGIELMRTLRSRISGLAIPTYAVDLPGGGGKVPVESSLRRIEEDRYILVDAEGREWSYPRSC
ncbi:MAG: KamA family radical SAM protein [Spirochaetales bacterium]